LPTERDSNSATTYAATSYDNRKREYCFEEGSFRGAPFFSTKLAATPVNARRRELSLAAFSRFLAFPQGLTSIAISFPALSVSRDAERRAESTIMVATGPRNLGPKLSESLINRPLRVNRQISVRTEISLPSIRARLTQAPLNHGCAFTDSLDCQIREETMHRCP
jgi:hypothetical protein